MLNFVHTLYLDPSMYSIIAVSVGSIAIAVGTTFVIWYRRVKKKVAETFHLDENANKEVEEELVILDEETKQ